MTTKLLIVILLTHAMVFLAGMSFGGVLSLHEMRKMGSDIHTFYWLYIPNLPAGWLWWLAFVIIGTVWVMRS